MERCRGPASALEQDMCQVSPDRDKNREDIRRTWILAPIRRHFQQLELEMELQDLQQVHADSDSRGCDTGKNQRKF